MTSLPLFAAVTFGKVLGWIFAGLAVLVFFSLSVLIHEAGHFLAARLLGLRADAFALGFGKALWKRKVGDTEYRINAIPFGGYVQLPQLDPAGMQAIQGGNADAGAVPPAAWWKRAIVAVAGPAGNVVFAAVLSLVVWCLPPVVPESLDFDGAVDGVVLPSSDAERAGIRPGDRILSVAGRPVGTWSDYRVETHLCGEGESIGLTLTNVVEGGAVRSVSAKLSADEFGYRTVAGAMEAVACAVVSVTPGSPAERAGFRPGDVVSALDGVRVVSVPAFVHSVSNSLGAPLSVSYRRGKSDGRIVLRAENIAPEPGAKPRYMIGLTLAPKAVTVPQWARFRRPADQLRGDAGSIFRVLKPLVGAGRKGEARRVGGSLGGPIVILSSMWMTMLAGFAGALAFIRFLNVNLAILNLLPIPVLDGGHVVFALWRGIFRREMPARLMDGLVNVFAVLLILLFVYLSFHDVWILATRFFR